MEHRLSRLCILLATSLWVAGPVHAKKKKKAAEEDDGVTRITPVELDPDLSELDEFEEPDEGEGPDAEPEDEFDAPSIDIRPLLPEDAPFEDELPKPKKKSDSVDVRILPGSQLGSGPGGMLTPDDLPHLPPPQAEREPPGWIRSLLTWLAEPEQYALDRDPDAGGTAADAAFGAYKRSPDGIAFAVSDLVPEFEICLDAHSTEIVGETGSVRLSFQIEKNGSISEIATEGSAGIRLDGCFTDALASLWFERGRIELPVEIPLKLRVR